MQKRLFFLIAMMLMVSLVPLCRPYTSLQEPAILQ